MRVGTIRLTAILAAPLLFAGVQPCRGTDLCKEIIIDRTAADVLARLADAQHQPDANSKATDLRMARARFAQTLNDLTTVWTCAANLDTKFAATLELRRFDKQVGATTGSGGSTSLVKSGSVPALLGLAVEYGGVIESFSGTTVTLRTTPAKLLAAMAKLYGPNSEPPSDLTLRALEHVSLSAAFDTSRSTTAAVKQGPTLQANYQQLSNATLRVLVLNDRDPLAPRNWQRIRALSLEPDSQAVADRGRELLAPLTRLPDFTRAKDAAMNAYDALDKDKADASAVSDLLATFVTSVRLLTAALPEWQQLLDAYGAARLLLDGRHKQLYRDISRSPSLTLEYALSRPPAITTTTAEPNPAGGVVAPDLSSMSAIYVASLLESDYTVTASASFFNQTQIGMKGSFRDFQVAGKWDIPVGRMPTFMAKGTLTLSGLYEHLHQRPLGIDLVINNQIINRPGDIGVFQAKYSIPVGDSGVQVPIAITAATRTELIKETSVRGNIGITLDLDKLMVAK